MSAHYETVAVCITTFHREVQLARLLEGLSRIERPSPDSGGRWIETIVVDNATAGTSRSAAERFTHELPSLRWEHEPEPGIAAARNRAVDASTADLICFIDDDEVPECDWLVELVSSLIGNPRAAAAVGVVEYDFERPLPDWLEASRVFEPFNFVPNEPPEYFATGNAGLRRRVLHPLEPLFDKQFGLTGGEDHHLGVRMQRSGFEVVSARDAVVREHVPAERMTRKFVTRRLRRKGWALAATDLSLGVGRSGACRVRHFGIGVGRILFGGALGTTEALRGRQGWAGWRQVLLGIGEVQGALGAVVAEYDRG